MLYLFFSAFSCFFFYFDFFAVLLRCQLVLLYRPREAVAMSFLVVRVDALAVVSLLCCIKQMRIVAVSYYPLAAALCGNHHVTISAFRQFTRNTENGGNHGNNAPLSQNAFSFGFASWLNQHDNVTASHKRHSNCPGSVFSIQAQAQAQFQDSAKGPSHGQATPPAPSCQPPPASCPCLCRPHPQLGRKYFWDQIIFIALA